MSIKPADGISPIQKAAELIGAYFRPEKREDGLLPIIEYVFRESQKPWSIIFLDPNGVLNNPMTLQMSADKIEEKLGELFKKTRLVAEGGREHFGYTSLQHEHVFGHFYNGLALDRFHKLIDQVSEVARVAIVWRPIAFSAEQLRELIFVQHKFSRYILDVTFASPKFKSRADQIQAWLQANQEKSKSGRFVILSRQDESLASKFPNNFINVGPPVFLETHREKAYEILTGVKPTPVLKPSEKQVRIEGKRTA